jgi:hypothetical protein
MTDDLALAPEQHRPALRDVLFRLQMLHGAAAQPREHKVLERGAGVYELQMFGYALGLTAVHLRAAQALPHVTDVHVSFSARGIAPGVHGALCVRMALTDKRALDADDGPRRRARPENYDPDAGWLASIFSGH